ncbi:hypothetical protein CCMSSC00406_0009548 [Pleurotus cornucopiae]|uniref:Uncharacterized protein n=1 Tax=Pleurotus cornucopiae TaxID=5321 RepID=A0ACB7IPP6_PLECO|nr:hypothetical protein CCMSSC00406_0009548 [Pleurotus cornucopiae]
MFATVDDASRSSSSSTASLLSDFVSGERYLGSPSTWKGKQKSLVTGNGGGPSSIAEMKVQVQQTESSCRCISTPFPYEWALAHKISPSKWTPDLVTWSCSSQACSQTGGRLYDPSSSRPTGQQFEIPYLRGRAAGPVVWDRFEIGGYSIENQAIAAVDDVSDEPLSPDFVGILGLALPMNSIIARVLTPGTSDAPDGQSVPANLFSITPRYAAPSYRFISITLSRPGSDYPPSLLSIGRHPSAIRELHQDNDAAKDLNATKVQYSTLVSERSGILFWKVDVRGITVWVDGFAREVTLARGVSGTPWPTAVIDSGVPLILTTSAIANGIYGALGIGPASDGQYYVPCNTPLNLTLTLDDRPPVALHPLDLTGLPPKDTSSDFCIGLIQAADAALSSPTNGFGDMILGVPFMRSVYTVMGYDSPSEEGVFPNSTVPTTGSASSIRPRLGLLSLVDPRVAMDEFTRVRVAHQPLSTGGGAAGSNRAPSSGDGKKISVGIAVLIGLVGFFALCVALFALRWFITRRQWRNAGSSTSGGPKSTEYQPTRQGSPDVELTAVGWAGLRGKDRGTEARVMSEDELRALRYEAYMRKERVHSDYTTSSAQTRVNEQDSDIDGEMGFRKEAPYEGTPALTTEDHHPTTPSVSPSPSPIPAACRSQHSASTLSRSSYDSHPPLSEHDARRSIHADTTDELGVRLSMVGVGSGNRSSFMDPSSPHHTRFASFPSPEPPSGHSPPQADS